MAFNHGLALRSSSPASSEGSVHPGGRVKKAQDELLIKDKSFRRFAAGVERALALFDGTLEEWADYISFLGRLLKVLQSHPEGVTIVPSKLLVAKRLAQCLLPSLPSGVHQKALDVYDFIFVLIGTNGLAEDLGLYLPGISSTLTFASSTVRQLFLTLIDKHIVELPTDVLRPALKALILALLPGLEEESSDEFERTMQILAKIKYELRAAGKGEVFWQNLFLASMTSAGRRQGVLAFLNQYLPDLNSDSSKSTNLPQNSRPKSIEIAELTTPEPGLLLRCFATGISDGQALVKRGFLDLLVTRLPLHAPIFLNEVATNDLDLLVLSAVSVVLKKDMSLNRRLWAWFLGPGESETPNTKDNSPSAELYSSPAKQCVVENLDPEAYFRTFCIPPLLRILEAMLVRTNQVPSRMSRPYRIAFSLMDRWEIGRPVVHALFLPFIRNIWSYQESAPMQAEFQHVLRSASAFFDGVESGVIWSKMLELVIPKGKTKELVSQDLDLAIFVMANFKVREEEMIIIHIPLVSLAMLESLCESDEQAFRSTESVLDVNIQTKAYHVLRILTEMISDHAFLELEDGKEGTESPFVESEPVNGVHNIVVSFFERHPSSVETPRVPFTPAVLGQHFLHLLTPQLVNHIRNGSDGAVIFSLTQILLTVLAKVGTARGTRFDILIKEVRKRLALDAKSLNRVTFEFLSSTATLVAGLLSRNTSDEASHEDETVFAVSTLVRHLWPYLSPSIPQYNLEAVRLLISLQHATWQNELVTSTLSSLITEADVVSDRSRSPGYDVPERFATLWSLTSVEDMPPRNVSNGDKTSVAMSAPNLNKYSMEAFTSMLRQALISLLAVLCGPRDDRSDSCRNWLQGIVDLSSMFESVVIEVVQVLDLSHDIYISLTTDRLERADCALAVLYQFIATQSETQWLSFFRGLDAKLQKSEAHDSDLTSQSLQASIMSMSIKILLRYPDSTTKAPGELRMKLQRSALRIVRLLLTKSSNPGAKPSQIDHWLIRQLTNPICLRNTSFQSDLLDTLLTILTARKIMFNSRPRPHGILSGEGATAEDDASKMALSWEDAKRTTRGEGDEIDVEPSEQLLCCLLDGIVSPLAQSLIQRWVQVLCESTHLYTLSLFRITMKIVDVFCKQINASLLGFSSQYNKTSTRRQNFELPLLCLLNGLDFVLARVHERLLTEEDNLSTIHAPNSQQSFFGSIVSGAASSEPSQARNLTNNNRLTVVLCFQDALRTCSNVWSCQAIDLRDPSHNVASWRHASQRIRGRSRKILEHLVVAEPQEAMEVLAHIWVQAREADNPMQSGTAMDLVHTLAGSSPQLTLVALFNAVVSRTNPSTLKSAQRSTLSTTLHEQDLVRFITMYAQSLEDDVLDEIWKDCVLFIRNVLGNPLPYRQILIGLVDFVAILNAKLGNTNVGEDLLMREELRELFVRLLTAIFTTKPQNVSRDKQTSASAPNATMSTAHPEGVEHVLDKNFSMFQSLLGDSERLISVLINVAAHIIAPLIHSRLFPRNLNSATMGLLLKISKTPGSVKAWKRDVTEAFNDGKFFSSDPMVVQMGWLPLLCQLAIADHSIISEILSRLSPPTSAGTMFGIGAMAARTEVDRKAQLNLRRLATLLLAKERDFSTTELSILQAKLEELFTASTTSSPSAVTRADVFMVIRAMIIVFSPSHMARFWPILNLEFRAAFSSMSGSGGICPPGTYNSFSVLQACKLLDLLLLTNPEDFQPQQWVLVTDTIDATYRPNDWKSSAIVDEVAQSMMENELPKTSHENQSSYPTQLMSVGEEYRNLRKPWLGGEQTRSCAEKDIDDVLLKPFFGQLSIYVYERTYDLSEPNLEACRADLLADIFNDRTVVQG